MNSLNSVLLEGNLVKDPELTYTAGGTAVVAFAIGSNRMYKQDGEYKQEVSFFDVTCYSHLAEVSAEYLRKGRGVRVVGRLKQDRWEAEDGTHKARVYVVAEHIEFKPERRTAPAVEVSETRPLAG